MNINEFDIMDTVRTYKDNNTIYCLLEDVKAKKLNESFFIGCKSMRKCLEKHNIPDDKVIYMKHDKIYQPEYKTAEVYVDKEYVIQHILNIEEQENKKCIEQEQKKKERLEEYTKRKEYDENLLEVVPDVIILNDEEKFKDENDKSIDVMVRGEKTMDGIYFKAKDIASAFKYYRIDNTVLHNKGIYQYGKDYKFFLNDGKKELYLTYMGMLRFVFSAKGSLGNMLKECISKTLFVSQLGSQDSKDELASRMLNVDKSMITEVLRKSCGKVPCVYLFKIGRVGDMRNNINLVDFKDDNAIVYKFGQTNNLLRRTNEHSKIYGEYENNMFGLSLFTTIDCAYICQAENELRKYVSGQLYHVKDKKHKELIVLNNKDYEDIDQFYNKIYIEYSGKKTAIIEQLQDLQHEKEIAKLNYEKTLLGKNKEIELRDQEIKYLKQLNALKNGF